MTTERCPERRVWLWSPRIEEIEIVVVGPTLHIAPLFATINSAVEDWDGWDRVQIIVSGDNAAGLWAAQTRYATYDDPIAEAMLMFRSFLPLRVVQWATPSVRGGAVGEW